MKIPKSNTEIITDYLMSRLKLDFCEKNIIEAVAREFGVHPILFCLIKYCEDKAIELKQDKRPIYIYHEFMAKNIPILIEKARQYVNENIEKKELWIINLEK